MRTAPAAAAPRGLPCVLVLAHAGDGAGRRLATALASGGGGRPVDVVLTDDLQLARARWRHEVGTGRPSTVRLPDGRLLTDDPAAADGSAPLAAVVCRLAGVLAPQFTGSGVEDRDYAAAELAALLASWLRSLRCPVLNDPSPAALGGPSWSAAQWAVRAAAAGFSVAQVRVSSSARAGGVVGRRRHLPDAADLHLAGWQAPPDPWPAGHRPAAWPEPAVGHRTLLVAGSSVFGSAASELGTAAARLAGDAGCWLLEVSLQVPPGAWEDPAGWRFAGAEPVPRLPAPNQVAAAAGAVVELLAAPRARTPVTAAAAGR